MLAAGFVLVGGQSRRMGRDKALLPWKTGVLVQDIAATLASITEHVALIGPPAKFGNLGYPCRPDLHPGLGPLSGIETALASGIAELNLIVACDMPQLDSAHLGHLLETAASSTAKCLVTSDASGDIHPLCAVYRNTCLPTVRAALDERRLRLMDLIRELEAEIVPATGRLSNINTLEDWNALNVADGY